MARREGERVSVRLKNGSWVVEIYDPATRRKRHVRTSEFGMDAPHNERQTQRLERLALNARDARRPGVGDEPCDSFAERWTTGFPRSAATNVHNRERVKAFAGRPPRSVSRQEARTWGQANPKRVSAVRAMFSDAIEEGFAEGFAEANPFGRLGLKQADGRKGITVLTRVEVERLAELALEVDGPAFGRDVGAMVTWGAYTCMRPGETFAARFSRLSGDEYDVGAQYHSRLVRETLPKHGSTGRIYGPQQAQRAVLDRPRRLCDDLMFRTRRGRQFRQGALHRAWTPLRAAFMAELPAYHHLNERLARDADDRLDVYELHSFGASYMLNS